MMLKNINDVENYFNSLKIEGYQAKGNLKKGGQSIGIDVFNSVTKEMCYFRVLQSKKKIDIDRFKREVSILVDQKFKNKNIIDIKDYSLKDDSCWYISKKGIPFKDYWNDIRDINPNTVFEKAITFILDILNGLEKLHENKVVHRDIKPDNLIIIDDNIVLIDFGIVYKESNKRLTPLDSATGNSRFSPDQMMNWQEEIKPWLDIFQIGQLLIWMVSEKPLKNWQRALHWKYVEYNKDLSEYNLLIIKALTAITSNSSTSPKNASEFKNLINSLLKDYKVNNEKNDISNKLIDAINTQKINDIQNKVSNVEILSSEIEYAKFFEKSINQGIIAFLMTLDKKLNYEIILNKRLGEYESEILEVDKISFNPHGGASIQKECLSVRLNGEKGDISLQTFIYAQIPQYRELEYEKIPDGFSHFYFRFAFNGAGGTFNYDQLAKFHHLYFKNDGEVIVGLNNYQGTSSIQGFINFIIEHLSKIEIWTSIN